MVKGDRHKMKEDDSPELVGIRDVDDVLYVLSTLQILLDENGSKDGRHSRRDERDQHSGLEKACHGVGFLG